MLLLVVKHDQGNIEVLSPENYGMETWGMSTQEGLKQKEDILKLKPTWVSGVIVGKALYAGKINPQEVLKGC